MSDLTSFLASPLPDGFPIPPTFDPSADDTPMAEIQPIITAPPLYNPGRVRMRVFGFALTDAFLYDYCLTNKIGPLDTRNDISNARVEAVTTIRNKSGLRYASAIKTVYTGKLQNNHKGVPVPEYALCLVVANNKTEKMRQGPSEEVIRRAKSMVGDLTPMWYRMPG
ncbi:hypothetical protein FA95DRAFT_1564306 [Auriscalpium vulgare]|uniref:Uncharacterized protein n=1 Tax=Auriscalpium vulgare TaxID=40419 RepID=A0ACB8RFQ8_9AGAM|nr:hypothetical protein FA95DRAFT_1564306 [Auriscalpium vulgare]